MTNDRPELDIAHYAAQRAHQAVVQRVATVLAEMVASDLDRQRIDDCVRALRGERGAPGSEFDR